MRYTLFGSSGLRVSELALGTGTFGTGWGWGADAAESRRIFDGYLAAGGVVIDCADVYQFGESETILADLIAPERDRLVVSTKFSMGADPSGGPTETGNSRKTMVQALEASLRRLRTDRVDVLWAHVADGTTPSEEIVRGFDDLARAGKILYAGLSNFPAWRAARAATLAELRGAVPIAGLQVEYSLVERTAEREFFPLADALGLGLTLWSPLAGGLLTGKQRRGEDGRHSKGGGPVRREDARTGAVVDTVVSVAAELGVEPGQVALAWVRSRAEGLPAGAVTILGARTRAQLDENLAAAELELDPDVLERLDTVSAVEPGYPHEQIGDAELQAALRGRVDVAAPRRTVA